MIDNESNLTIIRSYIPGIDSFLVHIYRIHYKEGSLNPLSGALGNTLNFSVNVVNEGPWGVKLSTSDQSYLQFSDGINTFRARLLTDTIPGNSSNWTLMFSGEVLDTNFTVSSYQPEIFLRGTAKDSSLIGSFSTYPDAFDVAGIRLSSVSVNPNRARRGDTVIVDLRVRNSGNTKIAVNSDNLLCRWAIQWKNNFFRILY